MSIKRPDIYEHNNPLLPIVDSTFVRGGNIVVQSLYELTQLYQRYEQLKQFATIAYVKDIGKRYLLIGNPNNHASSAFTLNDWLKLDVESTSTEGGESGGGQLPAPTTQELSVRILYKQLMDLIRNSELIPGLNYTILDYDGLHGEFLSPAFDNHMEITVKAILPNQLSEEALFIHFVGNNKPKQYTGLYKVDGIENIEYLNTETATLAIEQVEIIPFSNDITASIQTPDGIYVFGLYCYKKLTDPHWTENADIYYQVNYVSTITIGEETWYCLLGESDSYLKTKDFITFINVDIVCDGEMTPSKWSQLQYLDGAYYLFTESLSNTYYKSSDGTNFNSQNFTSNLSIVDSIIIDGKLFVLPSSGYGIYRIFAESALRIGQLPENGPWETMSVGDDGIVYISGPHNYSIDLSIETPGYVLQSLNDSNLYNRQYTKFQFNGSTNTLQVGENGLNIRTSDGDFFSTTNIELFKKARVYQKTDSGNNYYYLIDRKRAIVFWNVPYYKVNKGLVTKLVDDYNNIASFDFKSSRIYENFLFGSVISLSDLSYSGACRNNNVFGTPYEIKALSLLTENGFSNLTLLNAPDRIANLTPADGNTQVQYLNYINGVGVLWYSYDNNLQMVAKVYDQSNETWSDYDVAITTSYEDLYTLRSESKLIPGNYYRITDYNTTTNQYNTQAAGHTFDIIVKALDEGNLSEEAYAVMHENDTYFENTKLESWDIKYCIDNDTSRFAWADVENGKGVIYYMKDEWSNECLYDFKNIQYLKNGEWLYTFGGTTDNSLTGNSYGNTIKEYMVSAGKLSLNYNTFGNGCHSNTFGIDCSSNTFGNNCHSNTFDFDCDFNTFGNNCYSNTFGGSCSTNTFGNGCIYNTFGNYCSSNTFGNNCSSNTFGNSCIYNNFYTGESGTTKKDYIRYIVLEDGCCYNNFYSSPTTSYSSYLQRIRIKGLEHTTQTDVQIELPSTNTNYEWVICYTSDGTLKQYCPDD